MKKLKLGHKWVMVNNTKVIVKEDEQSGLDAEALRKGQEEFEITLSEIEEILYAKVDKAAEIEAEKKKRK